MRWTRMPYVVPGVADPPSLVPSTSQQTWSKPHHVCVAPAHPDAGPLCTSTLSAMAHGRGAVPCWTWPLRSQPDCLAMTWQLLLQVPIMYSSSSAAAASNSPSYVGFYLHLSALCSTGSCACMLRSLFSPSADLIHLPFCKMLPCHGLRL